MMESVLEFGQLTSVDTGMGLTVWLSTGFHRKQLIALA